MRRWTFSHRSWWLAVALAVPVSQAHSLESSADAAALGSLQQEQQSDFNWTGEIAPGATLRVLTFGGRITVQQATGTQARVRGETRHAGRAEIEFLATRDGGDVRICALREDAECTNEGIRSERRWSRSRNQSARADFTIEVPRGVIVRVSSGNGDVSVSGATADVHASSGNGTVTVGPGASQVRASSGNGAVRVDEARGSVRASSGNGRVSVSTAAGPVHASTGNGNIEVAMSSLPGDGDMRFSSGNGSITLRVPADFSAELTARTGNGGFETDFPVQIQGTFSRNRFEGTIGSGGRNVRMTTGRGTIRVLRAGN